VYWSLQSYRRRLFLSLLRCSDRTWILTRSDLVYLLYNFPVRVWNVSSERCCNTCRKIHLQCPHASKCQRRDLKKSPYDEICNQLGTRFQKSNNCFFHWNYVIYRRPRNWNIVYRLPEPSIWLCWHSYSLYSFRSDFKDQWVLRWFSDELPLT